MHPIAFQILLHFREFCREHQNEKDSFIDILKSSASENKESRSQLCITSEFNKLFDEYTRYSQSTMDDTHGPTARHYMQYIDIINLYHIIDRAVREYDVNLYT